MVDEPLLMFSLSETWETILEPFDRARVQPQIKDGHIKFGNKNNPETKAGGHNVDHVHEIHLVSSFLHSLDNKSRKALCEWLHLNDSSNALQLKDILNRRENLIWMDKDLNAYKSIFYSKEIAVPPNPNRKSFSVPLFQDALVENALYALALNTLFNHEQVQAMWSITRDRISSLFSRYDASIAEAYETFVNKTQKRWSLANLHAIMMYRSSLRIDDDSALDVPEWSLAFFDPHLNTNRVIPEKPVFDEYKRGVEAFQERGATKKLKARKLPSANPMILVDYLDKHEKGLTRREPLMSARNIRHHSIHPMPAVRLLDARTLHSMVNMAKKLV